MTWLYFLFALGCFALAMRTQSMGLALLLLLGALVFMLVGALKLVAARIESRAQGGDVRLNPALEKQRLKQQQASTTSSGGGDGPVVVATPGSTGSRAKDSRHDEPGGQDGDAGGGDGGGGGD